MPLLMMRCGATPEISAPSNRIDPAVGTSVPDSMLKIVLLPEPFGPIRPRISPCSTRNDTLLTAVKPPKRFTNPSTVSTPEPPLTRLLALLVAERGSLRQRQHGLALRLALRPHHVRLVVDILDDYRERALVLAGHLSALAVEFDAEAQHRAALGNVDLQRRLAQGIGVDAAIFLDRARQHFGQEHVGVRRGHADMRGADRNPGLRLVELLADHLDDRRHFRIHALLVREPDRDRIGVENVIDVGAETFLQLLVDAVAGAVADQCREFQALLARLPPEQ